MLTRTIYFWAVPLAHALLREQRTLNGDSSHHLEIRIAAVQYLRDNPERLIESNLNRSWVECLSNMSILGTWADHYCTSCSRFIEFKDPDWSSKFCASKSEVHIFRRCILWRCHLYFKEMQIILSKSFFSGFISLLSLLLWVSTVPVSHMHSSSAYCFDLVEQLAQFHFHGH